jgi:hypothetical protein
MIEQQANAVTFLAFFVASKIGKTGLSVTVDIYRNGTQIVTAGNATSIGGGLYSYTLASGSVNADGEYAAIFKTTDATVDQQHIPALWVIGRAGIEYLDAAISSRLATAGYTAPPTAAQIVAAIDGTSADLDAIIGDLTTLLARLTATRAGNLDNLDAAVTSRLATEDYAPAPTVEQIDTALSETHGAGSWEDSGSAGAGAVAHTHLVDDGTNPLDGVAVWVSTDAAGTNVVASGVTNALGQVTLYLDVGSYYIWKQLAGWNFTNPETVTVEP